MRNIKWLIAAGLLVSATGCVETNGYPGTSYSGYPGNGYYAQPSYSSGGGLFSSLFNQQPTYQQPAYYQQQPAYYQAQPTYYQQPQTRYVPVPVQTQRYVPAQSSGSRSSWGRRDDDGDGIPNRYDRDKNNDGVPDRQQRRGWQG